MKVRDCKRRAEEERVERIRQARELEEKRKAEDELKRRDERSIPAVPDAGTFAFLGMPGGTALKVISGLLMVQAIIRVGVIHYLWNAFQPGTTDVLVNGFAIGWLLLAAASFTIGFGIIRRRQWMRPLGITLSGVAVLNDAFFAFAGLWNAAVWWWHGDFLWFLVLGSSSALYLAVQPRLSVGLVSACSFERVRLPPAPKYFQAGEARKEPCAFYLPLEIPGGAGFAGYRICDSQSAGTPAVLHRIVGCTAHPRSATGHTRYLPQRNIGFRFTAIRRHCLASPSARSTEPKTCVNDTTAWALAGNVSGRKRMTPQVLR